ncbi:MAG: PKD domain-containing protein [Bacteroidia bacterium]|nr:PKD domain-containing protein [Bacteroidia bacterium]
MLRFLLCCCLLLAVPFTGLQAQLSSCANADFEQNSFTNWSATTGWCCPINSTTPGLVAGRHTIMTGPGTDPNTNGAVTVVAPGGQYSARLGNDNIGAEAEQLTYQINVDPSNALFIYRYAVVLEDPNHTPQEQPRFEIRVYDQNGAALGCGTYNVYASAGIPGFVTIVNAFGSTIHYKDWTTVGIDLSPYLGQTVTIEFSTGDCALGGHFGYAYVDCYCSPLQILTDFCSGANSTTLTAPVGFASYLWNTGASTRSITVANAVVGTQYTCTMTSVTGCTVTLTAILTPTVIAGSYGEASRCQNAAAFHDSSQVVTGTPISQWLWDFGDGNTSGQQHPVHSYAAPGVYTVALTVTNMGGCTDTIRRQITIDPPPLAAFGTSAVCPGNPASFTDLSTSLNGPLMTWSWSFGDGSAIDTLRHPQHLFTSPGTYPVTLVVSDSIGCRDTLVQNIATLPGPEAGFSYVSACVNSQILFSDTSRSAGTTILSRVWDFGDGSPTVSGPAAPAHLYPGPGTYTATLVITTANGCVDTISAPVDVQSVPQAAFSSNTPCAGQLVQFSDLSSTAAGAVTAWAWDFGDASAPSFTQHPGHAYAAAGTYTVTLIVTGSNACSDTLQQSVNVLPAPLAGFAYTPVCPGVSSSFTDLTQFPAGTVTSWTWDFGDGSAPVNGQQPAHTFAAPGTYAVQLMVNGSNGCADTLLQMVDTEPLPQVAYFIPSGCEQAPVFFPNLSTIASGNIVSWSWDFGDGSPLSGASSPTHHFNAPGTYFVQLTGTSNRGCTASIQNEVTIHPRPQAAFSVPAFCPGESAYFNDQSTLSSGNIVDWIWNFGDASPRVFGDPSPVHSYPGAGTYTTELVVMSSEGCFDTISAPVLMHTLPQASFSTIGAPCQGMPIATSNTSSLPGGIISACQWQFGDGRSSNAVNPAIHYPQPGTYQISLMVTGNNGCTDSVSASVTVLPAPVPSILMQNSCSGEAVSFAAGSAGTGPLNAWSWNFGDGSTSVQPAPAHAYSQHGQYNVYLRVTDALGCVGDTLQPLQIYARPVAAFSAGDECPGVPVSFMNQSGIAPGYAISAWQWSFGDGTPLEATAGPQHSYASPGSYPVSLVAVSANGCRDTARSTLRIFPLPQVSFTADTVCAGLPSSFSNRSAIASGSIAAWNWDFGDGTAGSAYAPQHVYARGGTYPVRLTAVSDQGCVDSATAAVRVWRLPQAGIRADVQEGCEPLAVQFSDFSSSADGVVSGWFWDFGQGDTVSGPLPAFTYSSAGSYSVTLTVTSSLGCVHDSLHTAFIHVHPNPVAAFSYDPQQPSVYMPEVFFHDQSGGAAQWWWNFGDSATSVLQNPSHLYGSPGTYTVTLIVESSEGCRDTVWKVLEVEKDYAFWIPNAFTPNNDGRNDVFMVKGFGYTGYEMSIFNRWGERVYTGSNDAEGWDGTLGGEPVKMDVYVYKVDIRDVFGNPHSYTGRVTLVR